MDTSPEYIKQCEQAEEIQYQFNPDDHNCLWDFALKWDWDRNNEKYDGYIGYGGRKQQQFSTYDGYLWHCIWLPRQDQLQEMIETTSLWNINHRYSRWLYDVNDDGVCDFHIRHIHENLKSMEQLWFAFVMAERYQKIWDGTEWIKVRY